MRRLGDESVRSYLGDLALCLRGRRGYPKMQTRLIEWASERRRLGDPCLHALVRRDGVHATHKRFFRLYNEAGRAVRRRRKRHGGAVERQILERLESSPCCPAP